MENRQSVGKQGAFADTLTPTLSLREREQFRASLPLRERVQSEENRLLPITSKSQGRR